MSFGESIVESCFRLICLLVVLSVPTIGECDEYRPPAPGVEISQTGNDSHLTIIGGGFLKGKDESGGDFYFPSCVIEKDEDNFLCARVGEKRLLLEPPHAIPPGYSSIYFSITGEVVVMKRGPRIKILRIGSFDAITFDSSDRLEEVAPGLFRRRVLDPPTLVRFGEESGVVLMQGWLDSNQLKGSFSQKTNETRCEAPFSRWHQKQSQRRSRRFSNRR